MINLRNTSQTFIVVLLLIVSALGGFFAGKNEITIAWEKYKPTVEVANREPPKSVDQRIDFKLFWDVFDRVQKQYIGKKDIDVQKMYYGAISGMVAALGDPYTVFLSPDQNKDTKDELAGHFEGIGAQLGVKDKKIIVISPLKDSPAEKAGVKPSDWIAQVDGKDTLSWTLPEAVSKIRGPRESKVKLTIVHENEEKPIELEVVRDTIVVKSVEWTQKDKDGKKVAVIKLSRFGEGTDDEWSSAVSEIIQLKQSSGNSFMGIVLDLRNNPGGFLSGAVFIASEFLPDGVVVIQENAQGERQNYTVNRVGKLLKDPMILLVNKGSASASEIVAGALSDRGRTKLIGEKSFGKGTIQEAQDLSEGAGLHITTAKWLTPKGNWVNETGGLIPDIEVKPDEKDPTKDVQLDRAFEELIK